MEMGAARVFEAKLTHGYWSGLDSKHQTQKTQLSNLGILCPGRLVSTPPFLSTVPSSASLTFLLAVERGTGMSLGVRDQMPSQYTRRARVFLHPYWPWKA
jgi:hypothetical protein